MFLHPETRRSVKAPSGGLIRLQDFVKDGELHHPTMLGADREECLIVVKNGAGSGVTFGRATGIESFVRDYRDNSTSMEIAILSYTCDDAAFSAAGDSGSVVADANNRIVGMITGGAGLTDSTDITYVTPYHFIIDSVKKVFPNAHLYSIPT
jgi:hypothetical protein